MESATIGSIVSISKGKKHSSLFDSPNGKAKRYIQIEDLRNDFNLKYTDEVGVDVNANDVIIAWDGANAGTIGFDLNGYIGSTLARLRIRDNIVHSKYLGWLLRGKFNYLRSQCTGATIPHISKSVLENISVPLPDLQTQQKIASILAQADAARQKRKQASQLTEQFLQSAFLEMFGDPVRNEKGWVSVKIEEIAIVNPRMTDEQRSLQDDTLVSFIPMAAVDEVEGRITLFDVREITEVKKGYTFFQEDDVLFAKITPCMENGKVAIARKLKNKLGFGTTEFHVIRCGKEIIPEYVHSIFRMKHVRNLASKNMTGSAGQQRVPSDFIKSFPIPVPPLPLQQKFAALVEQVERLRIKQRESERELDNLFQSLMQKYFS